MKSVMRRDWRGYSEDKLNTKLIVVTEENNIDPVQEHWNAFERKLV
jgi:hypothetical protein